MFDEVDESLRSLLVSDVPLDPAEVDISFARPAREWSSRLARPTVNLFLFDIRERTDFRDDALRVRETGNGTITRERAPRRVDLSYLITAWTREPEDEHRILARLLACLYRNPKLAADHLQGSLKDALLPVLLRAMSPDHLQKSVDFWGVMDNELHAGLTWVVTAPLDAFAPITGPMVTTREILVGPMAKPERRVSFQVAGIAHRAGDARDGLGGVSISLAGSALSTVTDARGRFSLAELPAGDHVLRVATSDGPAFEHSITVPSASYDVPIPEGTAPSRATRGPKSRDS
ncbi:MAG TPA: Pvc16 family protein [Tepidiformaceae bacterium]|nr:Pvc16 family protein [Tepidiformaceae bacterium]